MGESNGQQGEEGEMASIEQVTVPLAPAHVEGLDMETSSLGSDNSEASDSNGC